ncbi:MAG: helix-turn-helix domain-containing protein [Planctomycetota bacterium]|jgi:excisionase family DNA binding protein
MICHCGQHAPVVRQVPELGHVVRLRRCPAGHESVTLESEIRMLLAGALLGPMPTESYSLTTSDVAERLGVSKPTVYKWVRRGELEAVRLDKGWRFRPSAVWKLMIRRSDST